MIPEPRHHPVVGRRFKFADVVVVSPCEGGHVVLNTTHRHHIGLGRARAEADGRQGRSGAEGNLEALANPLGMAGRRMNESHRNHS